MLIIGAGGFAKEILEICHQNGQLTDLCFYDDVNADVGEFLFSKFKILKSQDAAQEYFAQIDSRFTLGLGNPQIREKLFEKFSQLGGVLTDTISRKADIGSYGVSIGKGANVLDGVKISNGVHIGNAPIIYYNAILTHDCVIGDFVEISPNVVILGKARVKSRAQIGTGSIILPHVTVGNNVIIGAGAVVTKDIPDNCIAYGVPARIIKQNL